MLVQLTDAMTELELSEKLFSVFARVHVSNDSVYCDGADLEASQHFAEGESFIEGTWTVARSLYNNRVGEENITYLSKQ